MMKFILILMFTFPLVSKGESRLYFNQFLGHVHKSASRDSSSLTIVQCSHSVRILKAKNNIPGWQYVQVGEDKGFVQEEYLSEKRPECLQAKYPKFYLEMGLDISDMYYWGKLNDHYIHGVTKIK